MLVFHRKDRIDSWLKMMLIFPSNLIALFFEDGFKNSAVAHINVLSLIKILLWQVLHETVCAWFPYLVCCSLPH